jgi:hypothetical protein
MPKYKVSVINEHFTSEDEVDCPNQEAALKQALKGALDIAGEHVASGQAFFGAEVVLNEESKRVLRMVISVGAAPLKS